MERLDEGGWKFANPSLRAEDRKGCNISNAFLLLKIAKGTSETLLNEWHPLDERIGWLANVSGLEPRLNTS